MRFAILVLACLFHSSNAAALAPATLFNFGAPQGVGAGALVRGADGNFYGTTAAGGAHDLGTFFRMTPGGVITTLASFDAGIGRAGLELVEGIDGNFYGVSATVSLPIPIFRATPTGELSVVATLACVPWDYRIGLARDNGGALYGTTICGDVFRVSPGGQLTTLASVAPRIPNTTLLAASDGNVYGTTVASYDRKPTIFRVTPQGILTTIATLGVMGDPHGLVEGTDGNFYGTTTDSDSAGSVFRVTPGGSVNRLAVISAKGYSRRLFLSELVRGSDGNFYGSYYGGAHNNNAFRVTPQGVITTIAALDATRAYAPPLHLVLGTDGDFYGTTAGGSAGRGAVLKLTPAGEVTTLASFWLDGDRAVGLVEGSDGRLYGSTANGGVYGAGNIFRLETDGAVNTLGSFSGAYNYSPPTMVLGRDGHLYGTTAMSTSCGFLFRVSMRGILRTVAQLAADPVCRPLSGLTLGPDGDFYFSAGDVFSAGTGIFKASPTGTIEKLADISRELAGPLLAASDGFFYGVLKYGPYPISCGDVFRTDASGQVTQLATLDCQSRGYAGGGLIEGLDGNFYGTSLGSSNAPPTVFRLASDGTITTVASFVGRPRPSGELLRASDGNFYGVTHGYADDNNESNDGGIVYSATTEGRIKTLATFSARDNGVLATSPIQAGDGALYGVTVRGGPLGHGTIYSLPGPPSIPVGVAATAGRASVTLTWNPAARAAAYRVYMGTSPGGEANHAVRAGLTATQLRIGQLTPGQTYYFTVKAINEVNLTQPSAEVSATPR